MIFNKDLPLEYILIPELKAGNYYLVQTTISYRPWLAGIASQYSDGGWWFSGNGCTVELQNVKNIWLLESR